MIMITLNNIEVGKKFAQPLYSINYTIDDVENGQRYVILPPGIPTRSQVINAVITEEYPLDKMEAVINNYLLDPTDEDAKAEMDAMQDFRKAAKKFADEVIEEINK